MAMLQKQSKSIRKKLLGDSSAKKGLVNNAVTGVGVDMSLRTVDNTFGAPIQRIFSLSLPIIGNIGPLEIANFLIHTGGKFTSNWAQGITAVLAAQAAKAGSIASFPIPGLNQVANPNVTATGPGAPL